MVLRRFTARKKNIIEALAVFGMWKQRDPSGSRFCSTDLERMSQKPRLARLPLAFLCRTQFGDRPGSQNSPSNRRIAGVTEAAEQQPAMLLHLRSALVEVPLVLPTEGGCITTYSSRFVGMSARTTGKG